MIGTMLTIAIVGYCINSCVANANKYATCKVLDNGRASKKQATGTIPN